MYNVQGLQFPNLRCLLLRGSSDFVGVIAGQYRSSGFPKLGLPLENCSCMSLNPKPLGVPIFGNHKSVI